MTQVLTEGRRAGEFLVSEANGYRSREAGVLAAGQNLPSGALLGLGQSDDVTIASAATAGNAGNGVMGAITASIGVKRGIYLLTFIEPVTNLGTFLVADPDGQQVGDGKVGTVFNGGGLSFTLADGANDFAAGDTFTITVTGGSEKYFAWNLANTDGSQIATAVLYDNVDATDGDKTVTIIARDAEVNGNIIDYNDDEISDANKALAAAQLAKKGIIIRS